MKLRRLVCVIKQPLCERDLSRFGITAALDQNIEVTVIDVSDLLHPDLKNERPFDFTHAGFSHLVVSRWVDLKKHSHLFARADLIVMAILSFGVSRGALPILRLIARSRTPYLIIRPQGYPRHNLASPRQPVISRLRDFAIRIAKMDLINSIVARLSPELLGIPRTAFAVFGSAEAATGGCPLMGPSTFRINAHSWDYDLYLEHRSAAGQVSKTAVFLDQYLPYHEDYIPLRASPLNAEDYYAGLRRVFERIENELGLKVAIAAHPRSYYADKPQAFGNRPVIHGETAALIAKSRLVIAHNSTGIGLAVAFQKPVMLIVTQELYHRQVYEKHFYDGFAEELGTPLRYFDRPDAMSLQGALLVDNKAYDRYLARYLRASDEDRPLWNIVYDAIAAPNPSKPP